MIVFIEGSQAVSLHYVGSHTASLLGAKYIRRRYTCDDVVGGRPIVHCNFDSLCLANIRYLIDVCRVKPVVWAVTEGRLLDGIVRFIKRYEGGIQSIVAVTGFVKGELEAVGLNVDDVVYYPPRFKPGDSHGKGIELLYISPYQERKYPGYLMAHCGRLRQLPLTVVTDRRNPYGRCFRSVSFEAHRLGDEEVRLLYLRSRIYVNLSDCEGFGLTPFEAWSVGTPVVAPRIPPFTETLPPQTLWVEPTGRVHYKLYSYVYIKHHEYDVDSFFEAVHRALDLASSNSYRAVSVEGMSWVWERFGDMHLKLARILEG